MSTKPYYKVWGCKIGTKGPLDLPGGSDQPMREAVKRAFFELTGRWPDFTFSGWADELTDSQKQVVEEDERTR